MAVQNEVKLIISGDPARAQQAMAAVQRSLVGLSAALPGINASLMRIGTALAAAFTFDKIVGNINRVIHSATEISHLADEFGMSTKAVAALRFQFEKLGESPDMFGMAFRTFAKAVTEALDPTSQMGQLFKAMGVSVRDASGNIRPMEELLTQTGAALGQYEHNAKFAALATELFGRSGVKFANVLGSQPDLIQKNAQELSKFSDAMDPASLEEYNAAMARLKKAYDGIWKTAAAGLLPTLSGLAKAFSESSIAGGDLKLIGDGIAAVFKVAATAAVALYAAIKWVSRGLGSMYEMSSQILHGNLGAAGEAAKGLFWGNALDVGEETLKQMEAIWAKAEQGAARKVEGGTKTAPGKADFSSGAQVDPEQEIQLQKRLALIEEARRVAADERARFTLSESGYHQELLALSQEQYRAEMALLDLKRETVAQMVEGVQKSQQQHQLDLEQLKITIAKADRDRQIQAQQRSNTWAGGIDKFRQFVEEGASQAAYVSGVLTQSLGGAITGISDGIMGLIDGTKTWGQTWLQVGRQVLAMLIQLTTQMIVMSLFKSVLGGIFGLSGGGLVPAYAGGGLIPGAPSASDNRLAMVATGEYVIPAERVSQFGVGVFEAFRQGHWPTPGQTLSVTPSDGSSFAGGGLVGAGGFNVQFAFLNSRQELREFMAREGWKYAVDPLTKRGVKIG